MAKMSIEVRSTDLPVERRLTLQPFVTRPQNCVLITMH
jgi:hypothetical protein